MNPDEIQRGNEGIDIGEWTGWSGPTDWAPYPIYPQPSDMPDLRGWLERDARQRAVTVVGMLAVGALIGALLVMTIGGLA